MLMKVVIKVEQAAVGIQLETPIADHALVMILIENPGAWLGHCRVQKRPGERAAIQGDAFGKRRPGKFAKRGQQVGEVGQLQGAAAGDVPGTVAAGRR